MFFVLVPWQHCSDWGGGWLSDLHFYDSQVQGAGGCWLGLFRSTPSHHSHIKTPTLNPKPIFALWKEFGQIIKWYKVQLAACWGAKTNRRQVPICGKQTLKANTWTSLSPSGTAPQATEHHTATWSSDDLRMYIFGGLTSSDLGQRGQRCEIWAWILNL